MKNLFKTLFVALTLTLIASCSKDSDSDPSNPNNNSNNNCTPIVCLNGGTQTVDCGCNCPQGYTGSNCGSQVTPKKIIITKAIVRKFPATDDFGDNWDVDLINPTNRLPDIYITVNNVSTMIYKSSTYAENASPSTFYSFNIIPNIELTDVYNKSYFIDIFDYDTNSSDDFMASTFFFAYTQNNGFPSVIRTDSLSTDLIVDLEVIYEF